jgi:hypothetical protein
MITVVEAVMGGLDPAIYVADTPALGTGGSVDHRVKPGNDDGD